VRDNAADYGPDHAAQSRPRSGPSTCSESWDGCPDARARARPDAAADANAHADVALPRVAVVALGAAAPAAAATHFVDSLTAT